MYYLRMIPGGASAWSYFSYGRLVDAPNDWLPNPQSSFLILFEKCKKSLQKNIKVYTHYFYANQRGEPAVPKNRRLHYIDSAVESWKELITRGWTEITDKFQE